MKTLSFNQFIERFKPIKQNEERGYRKYLLVNNYTAVTFYKACRVYSSNLFTGTQEGNMLTLFPGRKFSLEDSFFILTENAWEIPEEKIIIDLKKK